MQVAQTQHEKNLWYFQENFARNRTAAARLAERIINTVLADLDAMDYRAENGRLMVDEDLPAAKKIYGHNLVRIRSIEKFVDAVCGLIQNELRNS